MCKYGKCGIDNSEEIEDDNIGCATKAVVIPDYDDTRDRYFKNGKTNPIIWGPSGSYAPAHHGPQLGAHIESEWTCPEHFGHDNYQRGHLPQLCIRASGWKARVLAILLFWTLKKESI